MCFLRIIKIMLPPKVSTLQDIKENSNVEKVDIYGHCLYNFEFFYVIYYKAKNRLSILTFLNQTWIPNEL